MKFLDNLSFGQYIPADSPVHRCDPRCKIMSVLILLTGVFLVDSPVGFIFWGGLLWLLSLISKIGIPVLLRTVRPIMFLIIFTAIINLFFTSGTPLFEIGPISITKEGVRLGAYMALRLLFLILFANLLTLTTSPMALADGIESLLSPFKRLGLPAHEMAMMMTIALRFIPTLMNETDRIMKAQLARGADLDRGGLIKRLKAFIPVLIPLFVIVFQRADDLAVAMEARCYRGGGGRTRMRPFAWGTGETLSLGFVLTVVVALTVLERNIGL
ncbi:cobalt transport protein [Dethiosulfovibrio peptidovorans DSM 11002]|uniref:Cobalt transport protein n=1 Tax=Dethiosulfovibrio peptidovorans DSM 11002 TaxID=469381 RepID=D2Z944_9BACT|nr:energy-coupling factor transporter transmembrane component T [Dethiosulfovibrio peptidovorans]EFC91991.1 cobalt transport protein [Dethiosulfovibrio peptidovorans DSM 11002]